VEAVTQMSTHDTPDDLYAEARHHFDEKALADLTLAIIAINRWNRLAIPFRAQAGNYQPKTMQTA
ncbi:MAG: carboxymuconolactone decarboxylase family protein, partial [Gammaproteobacteria bacterium]